MRDDSTEERGGSSEAQADFGTPLSDVFISASDLLEIHLKSRGRKLLSEVSQKVPKSGILAIIILPLAFAFACYGLVFSGLSYLFIVAFPNMPSEATHSFAHAMILISLTLFGWLGIKRLSASLEY
jgi:hypothetical protein